jgi:bifunctional oligoribonuclease and PAP phosphatase NrnA
MSLRLPDREARIVGRILAAVKGGDTFVITSHTALDGDSISCELALLAALERMGKRAEIVNQDPVPATYRFLPGSARALPRRRSRRVSADAVFALDCGDISRLGRIRRLLPERAPLINIDHHISNTGYGDIAWVNPGYAACGEMIFFLLREMGPLTRAQSACLYTAILTDTGGFLYNFGEHTFRIAHELAASGIDPEDLARRVYFERPLNSLHLLRSCLASLQFDPRLRVCWIRVDLAMYRETGTTEEDTEGIITILKTVKEARMVFLLKERPDGVRVSLRSKGRYDVARLARALGGGGHREAAGTFLAGRTMREAERIVLEEIAHGRHPEP